MKKTYSKPEVMVVPLDEVLCAIGACRCNQSVQNCSSDQLESQGDCKS